MDLAGKDGRARGVLPRCALFAALFALVLMSALATGCASAQSQAVAPEDADEVEFEQDSIDDVLLGEAPSQVNAAQVGATSADLARRDADFAVDPNRTDWNFEGNGQKTVYLTIDDGPSQHTQAVLDILDLYGAKATFFVIGQDPAYFPMIKEAYNRGHTIGLHSYSHDYAQIYSSTDAFYADLDAIGQVVADQIGYVPCFIRFPGGSSNGISASYSAGIMTSLAASVQTLGYQYYDWNVSTGDGAEHPAWEIVDIATAPNDYDTIMLLCHDSATKQSTVDALPAIIEHYQALGYTFKAIDRSSYVCHHGINN